MPHVGTRIHKLRQQRKMSQQELARLVGVNQSFISKMESGEQTNPNAETLKRLARALGCTTDYLVGMYEDEDNDNELLPAAVALVGA
jgi:transcriptional regulator with XRE-family HTH domain